jgi:hypothetical protein
VGQSAFTTSTTSSSTDTSRKKMRRSDSIEGVWDHNFKLRVHWSGGQFLGHIIDVVIDVHVVSSNAPSPEPLGLRGETKVGMIRADT